MGIQIHPTAIVSPHAELADGVVIGPFSIVDENVTVGRNTVLRPFVHLCPYTRIGEDAVIFEDAVIAPNRRTMPSRVKPAGSLGQPVGHQGKRDDPSRFRRGERDLGRR